MKRRLSVLWETDGICSDRPSRIWSEGDCCEARDSVEDSCLCKNQSYLVSGSPISTRREIVVVREVCKALCDAEMDLLYE